MILMTIMALAAAFGLFWTVKTKKLFPAIITIGMVVGIALVILQIKDLKTIGFYVYMVFTFLAFLYGITTKGKCLESRIVISLLAASIFTYWLWTLNHWHGNTNLFAITALIVGIVGIVRRSKLKNEFGFIVILTVDAFAILLEKFLKTI